MRRLVLLALLILSPAALADGAGGPGLARLVDSPELKAAFAQASQGEVELMFDVDADGRVENPRILHSQPAGVFDAAALSMVAGRRAPASSRPRSGERLRDQRIVLRFRDDPDPAAKVQFGE